jgi:hypothetical protein
MSLSPESHLYVSTMSKSFVIKFVLFAILGMMIGYAQPSLPRIFLSDPALLARTQQACLANHQDYRKALKALQSEAEKLLRTQPLSVMEKSQIPPSGDKHDYMSLGCYFWPDPSKQDSLPYINRDGEVNPETESITDSKHLEKMSKTVYTLGLAFLLTQNEQYAEHAARFVRAWFLDSASRMNPNLNFVRAWFLDSASRMNPNLNFAQGVKGKETGRSSGLIDARNLSLVVDGIGMIAGSGKWTEQDQRELMTWCDEYLNWLLTSKIGLGEAKSGNNHGVWYDVQRVSIALFVGKREVARDILERAKTERIAKQIEPDGSMPRELARTLSQHYTQFNLEALFKLAELGRAVNVDLLHYTTDDGRSIKKALDYVIPYMAGEKTWEHKQLREFYWSEYYSLFVQAAVLYGDQRYAENARRIGKDKDYRSRVYLLYGY